MLLLAADSSESSVWEDAVMLLTWFLIVVISLLIYRCATHYFTFLEITAQSGRSAAWVLRQFPRDVLNALALFLRAGILIFRLNVYDALDDFYDSYYVFIADYGDVEAVLDLLVAARAAGFFNEDAGADAPFLNTLAGDFGADLLSAYFFYLNKLLMFILFILEEVLRLLLGFYLCYLIIFEMHQVSGAYCEDDLNAFLRRGGR